MVLFSAQTAKQGQGTEQTREHMSMKQLVARILPAQLLNTLRNLRDRRRLSAVPANSFESADLRNARDCEPLLASFADHAIAPLWQAAQIEIGAACQSGAHCSIS